MSALAIDLGGTYIKIGLFQDQSVLFEERFPAQSEMGLRPQLESLIKRIERVISRSEEKVHGLGIAFPGIVDSKNMMILSTNKKYRDAVNFDFKHWSENRFGLPVSLESDARSALMGEFVFGAARGKRDVVMITLGTGVGTATLIGGKLLHGAHFQAGGMGGHFSVNWEGNLCNCGNIGCVETEASSWSLPQTARSLDGFVQSLLAKEANLDFEAVFRLASTDTFSRMLVDRSMNVWAAAVVNLVHAYDPELVVMGGGVMASKKTIIPYIQEAVAARSWTPWGDVKVVVAEHGDASVLLGAGYLADRL